MNGCILGIKQEQSQRFSEAGVRMPITTIHTSPTYLVGITSSEKQGYVSIKLGFGTSKNIAKPVKGELKKAGIEAPLRFLKEFRLDNTRDITVIEEDGKRGVQCGEVKVFIGEEIKPELFFKAGDMIDVSGVSIGKGFQGVVKRHGFAGGPKTHGQSDRWRAPGSIGSGTTIGRIFKGLRMAGRMGGDRVTVAGLQVVEVTDTGLVIKGLVPGRRNGLLEVRKQ